jgi:hypothetical protein
VNRYPQPTPASRLLGGVLVGLVLLVILGIAGWIESL